MKGNYPKICEGDIYEILIVDGKTFEVQYGYYEDFEREQLEPIPIYPNLEITPIYGASGKRIITHMQEPCVHFKSQSGEDTEACCGCCEYYPTNGQMINACLCKENQVEVQLERREEI